MQDILKSLLSTDYHRYDSTVLERLKLAAEDETFALEFVQQKGLEHLLRLFSNEEKSIRSFTELLVFRIVEHVDDLVMSIILRIYSVHCTTSSPINLQCIGMIWDRWIP